MDLETLSNKILDEDFGLDVVHSDLDPPIEEEVDETPVEDIEIVSDESDDDDSLEHYGVLGMKWGVRKDRKGKPKKRERRFEGETDQQYQNRMDRDARERQQKAAIKEHLKTQKAQLKSQEKQQRLQLKSQEKQQRENIKAREQERKEQAKAQEKERERQAKEAARREAKERKKSKEKTDSKPHKATSLTDAELNDAINRLRNEKTYKELSLQNKSLPKKTLVKAATIGGGILLAVGTTVAKNQLTAVGNEKASDYLKKKGLLKNAPKSNLSTDDITKMINNAINEAKNQGVL